MKKKCIISAIGKESLHKSWISSGNKDIDLHLIVFDDSYEIHKNDAKYVAKGKGQKFRLIHEYLSKHKNFMSAYDYFFLPDDDVFIDDVNIDKLFNYMDLYKLDLAQPALTSSFYSFPVTVKQSDCILRYTNFVEMMQPCFSKKAIKKCFYTFNINECGWGMDYHWGNIIDSNKKKVAIIDDIISVHTRPFSLTPEKKQFNFKEMYDYLDRYKITTNILEYGRISKLPTRPIISHDESA